MAWIAFIALILVGLFSRYFSKGRIELLIELYRNAFHSLADEMEEKIQSHELMNDTQALELLRTIQNAARTGFLDGMTLAALIFATATAPKDLREGSSQNTLPLWLRGYADRRNQLLIEFLAKRHPYLTFCVLLSSPFLIQRQRKMGTREELTQMAFSHAA